MLRSWLLASLRFAVTLQSEDKLVFLAVAAELNRQGSSGPSFEQCFNFFQRTSVAICLAVVSEADEHRTVVLQSIWRGFPMSVSDPPLRQRSTLNFRWKEQANRANLRQATYGKACAHVCRPGQWKTMCASVVRASLDQAL
ncbi:hypothetical protein [Tardiphaga robiniae]|uniref:hypothetical protein n=1 Tax=Tardiphaga robiniae TaxID=943830 RepID=UPI001111F5EA|nr:hypothetical protein [Tardiphaga robiniae]